MVTAEGQIGDLRGQVGEVRDQIGELWGQVGEVRGEISGLKSRMDDMYRLLLVLIGIAGGGLVTAITAVVLQLVK